MIGQCKQCGFEAGVFGLDNGLCEQCRNKSSELAGTSNTKNAALKSSILDTSDEAIISKAIEEKDFTGLTGLLWSVIRVVILIPVFLLVLLYAANSYGILGAAVAFIGVGMILVQAVKNLMLDIKGYKNYKLILNYNKAHTRGEPK